MWRRGELEHWRVHPAVQLALPVTWSVSASEEEADVVILPPFHLHSALGRFLTILTISVPSGMNSTVYTFQSGQFFTIFLYIIFPILHDFNRFV
jgi:hypothetical protein